MADTVQPADAAGEADVQSEEEAMPLAGAAEAFKEDERVSIVQQVEACLAVLAQHPGQLHVPLGARPKQVPKNSWADLEDVSDVSSISNRWEEGSVPRTGTAVTVPNGTHYSRLDREASSTSAPFFLRALRSTMGHAALRGRPRH